MFVNHYFYSWKVFVWKEQYLNPSLLILFCWKEYQWEWYCWNACVLVTRVHTYTIAGMSNLFSK